MKILHAIVANTLINAFILYIIAKYAGVFGFHGFGIEPSEALTIEIMVALGFLFWIVYYIARNIIKFITFPIRWLSLGVLTVLINVGMFYFFQWLVGRLNINVDGTQIHIVLGNFVQIIVLSVIVYLLNLLLKTN